MDIIVQLLSPDFRWLWIEIGKNICLSFVLALPLAIVSKKIWPVAMSMLIGVFAIDLHGYSKVLSGLGFGTQLLNGRTIVNSYGFELFLIGVIYLFYIIYIMRNRNIANNWKIKERFSLLILSVACGFQANIFIDTLYKNDELYYEPLTTLLRYFLEVRFEDIPKLLLAMYMAIFLAGICVFSWEYLQQKNNVNIRTK